MNSHITIVVGDAEHCVQDEFRYPCLNMLRFVRAVSAKEQWYLLVNDAWRASGLPENQVVKEYLGTMLERSFTNINLFDRLKAFQYVEHVLGLRSLADEGMQDVADMALQYVAFFPERSTYRHEPRSLTYSAELGTNLYRELAWKAAGKDDWFSKAYAAMAASFGQAVMALRSVCPRFVSQKEIRMVAADNAVRLLPDHEATRALARLRDFDLMFCAQAERTGLQ